ncbi:MAG: hypothetical protein ACRYGA_03745 [Janthinobacterium lividum]
MNVVSQYLSGDVLRTRRVSDLVPHATLDLPTLPARLLADWERETSSRLDLEPGDVEQLPLARARARWPDHRRCVRAAADWTASMGLGTVLATADIALMACRGARYHHDGARYGAMAFCNLFLSEDKGLDLHFPRIDLRIPLVRGTVVVFDTGQPHAVVARGRNVFDVADFPDGRECSQVFLTWELPIENADVAHAMRIVFDTDPVEGHGSEEEQIRVDGRCADVCAESGRWISSAS